MGEGQPRVNLLEQRGRQHLHRHEAAGAGQLQHEPDDGQRLPDVAEGHRQRVHQVREHHRCQTARRQIQPEVLAFHAEEEHVAEPHDERLGEAYQAEHSVASEVQLSRPRRAPELPR